MGFDCITRTHAGCRRKLNEDAVLARGDLGLWAVADGMGGHDAGEVASALVVELLAAIVPDLDVSDRIAAVEAALREANERLIALGQEGPVERTVGSTVVALAADAAGFACLWAGDSRGYLARDGKLVQLTHDHSLVQMLVDAGALDAAEADGHPNANVVTRAVGAADLLDIDVVRGEVKAGDVFLLASDGLTRLLDADEMLAGLQSADLEAAADAFVATVIGRGAPDNLSFVMLRAD